MFKLQERYRGLQSPVGSASGFCLGHPIPVLNLKHSRHTVCTGKRLGDGNNQVRQLHQFHQNLRHVINDCHHFTLGQIPYVHLDGSDINQCNDSAVDNHISHRVHHRADFADKNLTVRQRLGKPPEASLLHLLLVESTNDADACQVLSSDPQHPVQIRLYLLVQRHGPHHDAENHHGQQRNRHYKHQRAFHINGKSHDHGAEYDNRRAQEQAQHQVHAGLDLVHVTGHAGNHGGCSRFVNISKIQPLDMVKQRLPQTRGKSHRRLGRKKLCRDGRHQPHHCQRQQAQTHPPDMPCIRSPCTVHIDASVDNAGHHQRHQQLEKGFQQLK